VIKFSMVWSCIEMV